MCAAVQNAVLFTNVLINMGITEAVFGLARPRFTNISIRIRYSGTLIPMAPAVVDCIRLTNAPKHMVAGITGKDLTFSRLALVFHSIFNISAVVPMTPAVGD